MIIDFPGLLETLVHEHVSFVIIGGLALVARGGTRATRDLDICYDRSPENLQRLAAALAPIAPRPRDFPPELPFFWDAATLRSGLQFTLTTKLGAVDLLGEVTGVGAFLAVRALATELELFGQKVLVLDLDGLEQAKRAAGRAKDLLDLAEISAIRKRQK